MANVGSSFITVEFMSITGYFRAARQWFLKTPERALNQAYEAALTIKSIEDKYFQGKRISPTAGEFGEVTRTYVTSELKRCLNEIKKRLAEFNTSRTVFRSTDQRVTEVQISDNPPEDWYTVGVIDKPAEVLKKLRFIDEVLARYQPSRVKSESALATTPLQPQPLELNAKTSDRPRPNRTPKLDPVAATQRNGNRPSDDLPPKIEALSDRTSFLPRSILRTVDRLKQELDPQAEEEVVQSFRMSRAKTTGALKFILLLIIIPLLTQQVSKNFLVGPVVDYVRVQQEAGVFLNLEMEEEALHELQRFEERLRFEVLIGKVQPMSELEIETTVRDKATEVEEEYRRRSADAIKNVFSDIFASLGFAAVLLNSRREIAILKSFIDEIVYGLSDSAKAFVIILFTDTFVGYHSPHGWEVLLEGLSRHFGLAANRDFIFLFIATFPVILDTVFKYWIFRYLNRISPSAVATYKNMNE